MAKKTSKFICVAVEGSTTDGRVIERQWLEDMAATYDPKTYGARINLDHFSWAWPDGPFNKHGDVVALKTQEVEVLGEKRLGLFAQLACLDSLQILAEQEQKVYWSVEITPNFAKSGKAYLTGLAATDNPASLGTEVLQFASTAKQNPFAYRKTSPEAMIAEAIEAAIEFDDEGDGDGKDSSTLKVFFNNLTTAIAEAFKKESQANITNQEFDANFDFEAHANKLATVVAEQVQSEFTAQSKKIEDLTATVEKLSADLNALTTKLSTEPADNENGQRPPAAGGDGANKIKTDC